MQTTYPAMNHLQKTLLATLLMPTLLVHSPSKAADLRNNCFKDQYGMGSYCVYVDTTKHIKTIMINFYAPRQGPGSITYSGTSLRPGDYLSNDHGYAMKTRIKYMDSKKIILQHFSGSGDPTTETYFR